MKKINKKHPFIFISLFILSVLVSCKKNDDQPNVNTATQVSAAVSSGSWKVTYFLDHDTDETSDFGGYAFTFAASGTVTATKGSSTVTGDWSAGNDDSKVKLVLDFDDALFEELAEDWELIKATATHIELMHKSGGDGHIDYLTFEKI